MLMLLTHRLHQLRSLRITGCSSYDKSEELCALTKERDGLKSKAEAHAREILSLSSDVKKLEVALAEARITARAQDMFASQASAGIRVDQTSANELSTLKKKHHAMASELLQIKALFDAQVETNATLKQTCKALLQALGTITDQGVASKPTEATTSASSAVMEYAQQLLLQQVSEGAKIEQKPAVNSSSASSTSGFEVVEDDI